MKIVTNDDYYDSINILDEEEPIIAVEAFNFDTISYQQIAPILSNTFPMLKPEPEPALPEIHVI